MKIRHFLSLLLVATLLLGMGAPAFAVGEDPQAITLGSGDGDRTADFLITNPYESVVWDTWGQYKGNFHTHSKASDGKESLATMVEKYYELGYDILAMADHSTLSLRWDEQPIGPTGPIKITLGELAELFEIDPALLIAAGITDPLDTVIETMGQLDEYYIKMGEDPSDNPPDRALENSLFCGRPTDVLTTERYNEIINGTGPEERKMTQVMYGNEHNFIKGDHVNTYFANLVTPGMGSLESVIEMAQYNNGLSQINHPGRYTGSPEIPDQATVKKYADLLLRYSSCLGFEISNKNDSHGNDRVLWDYVLMETAPKGRNVFAYGNDDAHKLADIGRNWNMMLMPENTPENVRRAMETGASYVSTRRAKAEGVDATGSSDPTPSITKIEIDETTDTITITGDNYTSIEWIADAQIIVTEAYNASGNSLNLRDYDSEIGSYIRFQLKGTGGISFAQPFILERSELQLIVPENWELEIGDSRTVDYVFPAEVENRMLDWESSDESIATVDKWGRVTAENIGTVEISATQLYGTGMKDSVTLNVVASSTPGAPHASVVNYQGTAIAEVENLQKIVTRWSTSEAQASEDVPDEIKAVLDGTDTDPYITATTADGAIWTITAYGVLRTGGIAATSRDEEMRFMGDRYFHHPVYANGTTEIPVVLSVFPDGENGIWTITASGVTHIAMVEMTARDKAIDMSDTSQDIVDRRGLVSQATLEGGVWQPRQTDNDGLWTSMYGAGELFRYATLKSELASNPGNAELQQMVADAKAVATRSVEAVLLLSNISMREGTEEAYVRYNTEGNNESRTYTGAQGQTIDDRGQGLSWTALEEGGDYSRKVPDFSPWDNSRHIIDMPLIASTGNVSAGFKGNPLWLAPFDPDAWSNPRDNPGNDYETQTRLLEGYWARTYFIEGSDDYDQNVDGRIYWRVNDDGTATGDNVKGETVNGEALKDETTNASGTIPPRLYELMGSPELDKIVYKGDTSMDEVIGHLFIYKIAYDILGPDDPELAEIIADTMEKFAQHLSDNSWMLVDGTGQPTTWGKLNREYFYSYRWGSPAGPMNCSVLLCAFKVAAYVTGNQKWEDEYQLAAKMAPYEYSTLMGQYEQKGYEFLSMFAAETLHDAGFTPLLGGDKSLIGHLKASRFNDEISLFTRMFAQYSDEEMAMLAFYLLFQLETDPELLADYRDAFDYWWDSSYQYSENPLWYYIYQLAYPNQTIIDAYGNNILATAAWSLSRHPVDTRRWNASNQQRDDIMNFNMDDYAGGTLGVRGGLSIEKTDLPPSAIGAGGIIAILLLGGVTKGSYNLNTIGVPMSGTLSLEYAVAAPDERAMHKYNNNSYKLDDQNEPYLMEASTTYTLPYWLGVYHGMLKPLPSTGFAGPIPGDPETDEKEPTPAYQLFNDVRLTDWFHNDVTFVANEGFFNGVDVKLFAPQSNMNRAMMATVLYRIAGEPAVSGTVSFKDVVVGEWYYNAIVWASANGIVTGYSDDVFGVGDNVTREQIATMFYRYAKFAKLDTGKTTNLAGFTDAGSVSGFALDAVKWAVASGIITGRDNKTLAPGASATRAEVAAMCTRFCGNIMGIT